MIIFNNTSFHIKISWWLLSGVILLTGCLATLGFWQLARSEEKQLIQNDIEHSLSADAIQLKTAIGESWKDLRYRHVKATGSFGDSFLIYIDNRVHQGQAGYHIISPFYLEDGSAIILVNRGWVSVGRDRKIIPEVRTPTGTLTINGRFSAPRSKPTMIGGQDAPDAYSKKVWTYLDINYVEKVHQIKLEPYIILQEDSELSKENNDLIRQLPDYESNVTMHIGYAIQWFAFALFVVLAFLKNSIKTGKKYD